MKSKSDKDGYGILHRLLEYVAAVAANNLNSTFDSYETEALASSVNCSGENINATECCVLCLRKKHDCCSMRTRRRTAINMPQTSVP